VLIDEDSKPYDSCVFITEAVGGGTGRTWHSPISTRLALVVCLAFLTALPGGWLALTLVTNQVPNGGWIALALAVAAWGVLGWRALGQSVTLTPETLVIRSVLSTRRVPLADITAVGFRGNLLTVTATRGERFKASAVSLGSSRWSGVRSSADAIAEAITAAAGLPPLPPRREIISRNWAWVLLLAALLCFGLGIYSGPLQTGHAGLPFALREVGAVLYGLGAVMLGQAFRITRDHWRKASR
jgi:hypothetical protein